MILRSSKWGARLTRQGPSTLQILGDQLQLTSDGASRAWRLLEIGSVDVEPGLAWLKITLRPIYGDPVSIGGFPKGEGRAWCAFAEEKLLATLSAMAYEASTVIEDWVGMALSQQPKGRWLAAWEASHFAETTAPPILTSGVHYDTVAGHPKLAQALGNSSPTKKIPASASSALAQAFDELNEQFFALESQRPLFCTLESSPLTQEQRRSVITFEKYLLVIAAAGSGKTATMAAKAAYAIEAGIVKPEEILMLAFNADAADEMRARIDKRLSHIAGFESICCWTFHKFGLEVIGQATGKKPRPASWLEGGQDSTKVASIIEELSHSDQDFLLKLKLIQYVFAKPLSHQGDRVPEPDLDPKTGKAGFRTNNGEVVKSEEERLIADWLFFNGVEYRYEASYEVDTADASHSQYHPDFYYPAIDLYHEHFALNQHGQPPKHFEGYLDGVKWKRTLHQQNGTSLIETTSHTLRSGEGFKYLQDELESRGIVLQPDLNRSAAAREPMDTKALASTLRTMMQHAKSNLLEPADLYSRAAKADPLRGPLIISLYEKVLGRWQADLEESNSVDFDDMINQAVAHAEAFTYRSPFKLVIADEFQDSSYNRARLLRAITAMPDATLTAVGDDAQAINSFAGADIGVMRHFSEFFSGGKIVLLSRTFRCPRQICEASSAFVQSNPNQIRKEVSTTSTVEGNCIQCYALENSSDIPSLLEQHITRIASKLASNWQSSRKPKVLVLGRYRRDKPKNWHSLVQACGDVAEIRYSTIHSSKGTEADYVLIVNVVDRMFPSEIVDDPILQVAMPDPDTFPFAEERRLFYVGLTRAIRGVFLYTTTQRPSAFLKELQALGWLRIVDSEGKTVAEHSCPDCKAGHQVLRHGKGRAFYGCSRYPLCRWTRKADA